jgi:ligand-binding sensor domain-containing protein
MVVNQQGQIWIIAPNNQGVIIYNSTNNTWYQLSTINNNLPSSSVTSILEDKKGTMWVGTNNGIGLFDCSELGNCKAYLPQIKNSNGFAGLLFQKEIVNPMAVDCANQKWVGTNNGCWLLSEDGSQILQRFSKNNSPLPNDTILQICIAPLSGEVFMNTNNQLVSYRSSANETIQSTQNIIVFPNPVLPNYEGPIAMKGFVNNAIVKITTLDGKLVFQTRALGGQAVWNGKTYEGSKVASGIYLVFARDDAGMEKSMGKIIITSGGQ